MKLSETGKKMILIIGLTTLIFIVLGLAYYGSDGFLPFALGVLLCAALNVLKVVMLEYTLDRALEMETQNASNFARLQYLLRFLLTGAVLVVAAVTPFISLWGAAAGIFTLQIAAISMKFFVRK